MFKIGDKVTCTRGRVLGPQKHSEYTVMDIKPYNQISVAEMQGYWDNNAFVLAVAQPQPQQARRSPFQPGGFVVCDHCFFGLDEPKKGDSYTVSSYCVVSDTLSLIGFPNKTFSASAFTRMPTSSGIRYSHSNSMDAFVYTENPFSREFNGVLPSKVRCECGTSSVGGSKHSSWCPIK